MGIRPHPLPGGSDRLRIHSIEGEGARARHRDDSALSSRAIRWRPATGPLQEGRLEGHRGQARASVDGYVTALFSARRHPGDVELGVETDGPQKGIAIRSGLGGINVGLGGPGCHPGQQDLAQGGWALEPV